MRPGSCRTRCSPIIRAISRCSWSWTGCLCGANWRKAAMSPSSEGRARALPIALAMGGGLVLALSLATWWWHIAGRKTRGLADYFFARQDMWVLDAQGLALFALALWA